MTTVTEALLVMLGRCDGAIKRDNVGFNGGDAEFAHSLGDAVSEYGHLTPKQEKAIHKTLLTYKKQLKDLGIEYNDLVIESDERVKAATKFSIVSSQYGKKIIVGFPYDAAIVKKLNALDWDDTHRRWNGSTWEIDANSNGLIGLEEVGFDIPEDIREACCQSPKTTKEAVMAEGAKVRILFHSNFSKLDRKPSKQVSDALNNKLAYQPPGYEWSPKYSSGEWDGWIRLYKHWDQSFPSGLIEMVKEVFDEFKVDYEVVDSRKEMNQIVLQWNGPELRDYQKEVVEQALKRTNGFIVMPTGAGKTLTALRMIYEEQRSAVILVCRKELLYQWADRVEKVLGVKVGIVGDGVYEEREITIAMLQTIANKPLNRDYDMLFCDEGHHMPAQTFQKSAERIRAKQRYSLSATMRREDGLEMLLWTQTGTLVANITVQDLVEWGYLAKPNFILLEHGEYFSGSNYNEEVQDMVDSEVRNRIIVDFVAKKHREGHKCYVDVKRIAHGQKLAAMLNEAGMDAKFISGNSSSKVRQEVLSTFEKDGFVLVSTLIKEGVDLPVMSLVCLAGGGKSGTVVVQTIGRALRPKKDINEADIVDMVDDGEFSGDHFEERQEVMADYYGDLYAPIYVRR